MNVPLDPKATDLVKWLKISPARYKEIEFLLWKFFHKDVSDKFTNREMLEFCINNAQSVAELILLVYNVSATSAKMLSVDSDGEDDRTQELIEKLKELKRKLED